MTSYTLNNWDGGASVSNLDQHAPQSSLGNIGPTHSTLNFSRNDVEKSVDALDVEELDGTEPGRRETLAIFGPLNEADFNNTPLNQLTVPAPRNSAVEKVPLGISANSESNTDARTADANDALVTRQIQPEMPIFVPIVESALHSPGARKDASLSTPGRSLTKLLQGGNAAPGSPTPVRAPVTGTFIELGLQAGLEAEKEREQETDNMSLHTTDAPGEDEDDDVIVVESNLLNFSPSKTDSNAGTRADSTPSRNHAAGSDTQDQQRHALSRPPAHMSLFTPPPSVESHSGRISSCPPADRLFTPEPESRLERLPAREAQPESDEDDVIIVTPRSFPLSAPTKVSSSNGKRKATEKASDDVRSRSKKRRVMSYVQVPPLKRPRSDYVMYGISGSSSASAGASHAGFVKKNRPILGPPPSAAGPSRLPSSYTSTNKAPKKGISATRKPNLQISDRRGSHKEHSSNSSSRNVGLSLGDALQASFNHNERVGTLIPGQVTGALARKKDKGKGKSRARQQDSNFESESDEEEDGRGNNRRRIMAAPATPARPAPARIQPSGGVGYGYSHGTRRPPPSTDSMTSATTTSGSVAIVAWQRTPTASLTATAKKKRPRAVTGVDADVYDVDAQDSDYDYRPSRRVKKKPRVDIDLTMATSEEEVHAKKSAAASGRRGWGEEEDDEVQILEVVKANGNAVKQKPRPRPPPPSVSTRLPAWSASMRPPPSPASTRLAASFVSERPRPTLPRPAMSSKSKGQSTAKPGSRPGAIKSFISKPQLKDKSKALSSPFSISRSRSKPSLQRAEGKENAHASKSSKSSLSKDKSEGRVLYSFNASTDVVRLVLGNVDPVSKDILGANLRRLKAEIGESVNGGLLAGLTKDVGQVKVGEEDERVRAPWACKPFKFSSSFFGSAQGDEDDISLGYPVSFVPDPSLMSLKVKAKSKEAGIQRAKPTQRQIEPAKPLEPLFTDSEDEITDVEDEDENRLQPESELEYETASDDIPLSGGASVLRGVQPSSSALSSNSRPRTLVTPSSAPGPVSISEPSAAAPASPQRQAPTPNQQPQPQPQQPQAPLKKIDLAAFYRKNRATISTAKRPAGSVRSASSSAQTEAVGDVGHSPSIARHTSQSQMHSHPAQMYPGSLFAAPVVSPSSSMSLSLSAGPAHSLNYQQHYPAGRQANADEYSGSAPALPSAKALGKRRAVSADPAYSQYGRAAFSTSPPPPPYTPPVLQQAFLAASNVAAVAAGAGASINVNLNTTINHVHHHSHLHASPHLPQTSQRLLRGPNADLDLFLVSPVRQSTSRGVELDVGTSTSAGLYATGYPSALNLRDEAVLLGASQSDLAHLYSPPGLGESQGRGDDGRMLSETILDDLDLPQPEDPWETLTDADGRYTYSTVNPALIGGEDDDAENMLGEKLLFSEDDEEAVIRTPEVESVVEVIREQSSVRDVSPAFSSTSSSSSSRRLLSSRSLSASATHPRPFSEQHQHQKSPCPSLPASSVAVSNADSDDDEYLPPNIKLGTVPKKSKSKGVVHDVPSPAIVSDIVAHVAIPRSVNAERDTTTPGSDFSNAPLSVSKRPRRKHVPRRMNDMVPTSELVSRKTGKKLESEYAPSTASAISGRGADGENATTSDAQASESDSADRVVVVKRKILKSGPPEAIQVGPLRPKAIVKDGPWPSTSRETFCHQCRSKTNRVKMPCTCGKEYCVRCYAIRYPNEEFNTKIKHFGCPACLKYCNCTACCKKRGEDYVSSSTRGPPGKRFALGGKTNLPSVPIPVLAPPPPSDLPTLSGPIPETAKYWGSIYSLTTGEKLTSTFITPDMGVDVVSGAPTVVYAPAAAAVPSQQPKKNKTMVKGRFFVGAVQRCWGLGRHPKARVIEPHKSLTSIRRRKGSAEALGRTSYVGNPAFLEYLLPEPEDPYNELLEGLSPLTSLEDSSDEEPDGVGDEAGMA